MNWLDIVFIVVVLLLTFIGWRTGIVRAAATIGGVIAGVYLAGQYHGQVADALSGVITSTNGANIAAFALVFIVVMVAAAIVGGIMRRVLKLILLGWVDGMVGALLGLGVGVALFSGFTLAFCIFPIGGLGSAVEGSAIAKNMRPVVGGLMPEQFRQYVSPDQCSGG